MSPMSPMRLLVALLLLLGFGVGAYAAFCPNPSFISGGQTATLPPCDFFVSTAGSDVNNGLTTATPFLTLAHAQSVVQNVTQKVICLRAGTFHQNSSITLTAADNGETWQYYQPDGVNTAVLDGGSTSATTGVDGLFILNGASNVTFNGIKMQNPKALAIFASSAAFGTTIENSDIGNNHTNNSGLGFGGFAPVLGMTGRNITIANNYLHDCANQCIGLYAFSAGDSIDGGLITGNVVLRAVQQADDGGAIYVNMHATSTAGGAVTVSNNYIRDQGGQLIGGVAGIYLDDNASNVTVTGNIVGSVPANWQGSGARQDAPCIEIFGGVGPVTPNQPQNDTIKNNICDLGSTARMLIIGAGPEAGQTNNVLSDNIFISNFAGTNNTQQFCPGQTICGQNTGLNVANNAYHNYGGGAEVTGSTPNDSTPQHYTGAQLGLSCANAVYTQTAGSTVNGAPVSFGALPTSWGPPGFTIPASPNHSC